MPLYEYACDNCRIKFDARQPVEFNAEAICPVCGGKAERQYSTFNFSFGWVLSDRCLNEKWGPKDEFVGNV